MDTEIPATEPNARPFERSRPIALLDDDAPVLPDDPAAVITTCANCGRQMIERKCKLICSCGYFLSCSDYY